jgi:hypothetical protein
MTTQLPMQLNTDSIGGDSGAQELVITVLIEMSDTPALEAEPVLHMNDWTLIAKRVLNGNDIKLQTIRH